MQFVVLGAAAHCPRDAGPDVGPDDLGRHVEGGAQRPQDVIGAHQAELGHHALGSFGSVKIPPAPYTRGHKQLRNYQSFVAYLVHSLVFSSSDISERFVDEKTVPYTKQWSVVFSSDLGLMFVSGLCPLASPKLAGLHQ